MRISLIVISESEIHHAILVFYNLVAGDLQQACILYPLAWCNAAHQPAKCFDSTHFKCYIIWQSIYAFNPSFAGYLRFF